MNTNITLEVNIDLYLGMADKEKKLNGKSDKEAIKCNDEWFEVMMFIMGAEVECYKSLWVYLDRNLALGDNKYPKNVTSTYEILTRYKPKLTRPQGPGRQINSEKGDRSSTVTHSPLSFAQVNEKSRNETPGDSTNITLKSNIKHVAYQIEGYIVICCPLNKLFSEIQPT